MTDNQDKAMNKIYTKSIMLVFFLSFTFFSLPAKAVSCHFINGGFTRFHNVDLGSVVLTTGGDKQNEYTVSWRQGITQNNQFECDQKEQVYISHTITDYADTKMRIVSGGISASPLMDSYRFQKTIGDYTTCYQPSTYQPGTGTGIGTGTQAGCRLIINANNSMYAESYLGPGGDFKFIFKRQFTKSDTQPSIDFLDLSLLPNFNYVLTDFSGNVLLVLDSFKFSGRVTAVNASCTTPNFTYDLGEHRSVEFKDVDSTTNWVDTPIILTNCTPFYGNMRSGKVSYLVDSVAGGVTNFVSQNEPNNIYISFSNAQMSLNDSNGILRLQYSPSSAQGFGVQLGVKINGAYSPINLRIPQVITPSVESYSQPPTVVTAFGRLVFPLGARYIKVAKNISGGTANTYAVYSINYE